jgi:hypothetical protein
MPHSPLERLKIDDWNHTIDVNLKDVLYGIAAALPHMQRQNGGHIINVSSVAGHKVGPGSAVYSATKTAVRVLSEGMCCKPENATASVCRDRDYAAAVRSKRRPTNAACPAMSCFGNHLTCPLRIMCIVSIP